MLETRALAPGEVDIPKDAPVWRLNPHQKIGEVERLVFDEDTSKAVALVVERGFLFTRDVVLPVEHVVEVVAGIVRVDLDDAALKALAEFKAAGLEERSLMAVVLITGCSSGFGLLSAVGFAKRGDRVFASMRDLTKAGALRDAAAQAGVEVEIVELDVSDDASVRRAVEQVIAAAGQIDVLVNNAGIGAVAAVEDFDDDEVLKVFDTNVFGVIRVVRAVLPHMRAKRSGRIVNVGSMAGVVPSQFRGIYSATKSALAALSDAMFYELHPWGIHSCVVEPGFFETGIGSNRMPTRRQASSDYAPAARALRGRWFDARRQRTRRPLACRRCHHPCRDGTHTAAPLHRRQGRRGAFVAEGEVPRR